MKIMHLISGGDVGGAKAHMIGLLEELSKGNELELVCFMDGPFAREALQRGIHTRVLKKRSLFRIARNLKKYLRNKHFDLLHCHGARANVTSLLMGRASCPVLSTVHSDSRLDDMGRPLPKRIVEIANRFALGAMEGLITVSDGLKERLVLRGCDGGRMHTIYNGICFPKKLPHMPRREYLQSLGLDWDQNCVVCGIAAWGEPVEDMTTLVKVFAQVVKAVPNIRLLIAASGDQEEIKSLAEELCPAGTVHFAGCVQDRNSFYHALDINLQGAVSDVFPYGIIEGARMRCCTISTAVGDVPKVILDNETGFLIPPDDLGILALRMIEAARDPKLRARLGGALYEKVKAEFSVETMGRQQEAVYRSVLNRWHREKQGRYGAVICGAYGKGNAGDDAILMCMLRQLRMQDPDLPITVMTRDPQQTALLTGVSTIHIFDILSAWRVMKKSSLYISGGGSLIQNATSNRSLLYYLFSIRQAKWAGCRVMIYGCGIGPVNGEENRKRTARILETSVDLITLRDPESLRTLRSFGVTGPKTQVTADPALLMEGDDKAAVRILRSNGLDPEGRYCLFVLRPWDVTRERLADIAAAADYCREKYGLMPLFYTLEPGRDDEITRATAELVKAPCRVLPPVTDGTVLCGLIGRMELVVSMRLHALIFACAQQTKVAAISYDPKVTGFMNYLGSESCVELSDASGKAIKDMIDRALIWEIPAQVDHLKALAAENGVLAGELLNM